MAELSEIQAALQAEGLAGWLFYSFRGSDPLALAILNLGTAAQQSRRWYYFVPAQGVPVQIVHAIEPHALAALPGDRLIYRRWQELSQHLASLATRLSQTGVVPATNEASTPSALPQVAMQYSPLNAIPYVSRVDAGTVELVRQAGLDVVSSANLVSRFEATLTPAQQQSHRQAADLLGRLVDEVFAEVAQRVRASETAASVPPPTEYEIQQFLLGMFEQNGLVTDHPPIVAVNAHSADPHFAPTPAVTATIRRGDFLLLDLWAKLDTADGIIADITWTLAIAEEAPAEFEEVFQIVRRARDAGIAAVTSAFADNRPIRGCDVDDVVRDVIETAGYGDSFLHRTGHSIHRMTHGNGANLDNLETQDERRLLPATCFSIEPGIYLANKFGIRSEIDVLIDDAGQVSVTGRPPQTTLLTLRDYPGINEN